MVILKYWSNGDKAFSSKRSKIPLVSWMDKNTPNNAIIQMTEFLIFDVAVETKRLKLMIQEAEKMDKTIPFTRLHESARFVRSDTKIK